MSFLHVVLTVCPFVVMITISQNLVVQGSKENPLGFGGDWNHFYLFCELHIRSHQISAPPDLFGAVCEMESSLSQNTLEDVKY